VLGVVEVVLKLLVRITNGRSISAHDLSPSGDARFQIIATHLTRPDGTLPLLGGDDGGRALALNRRDYASFQDGLCLGAILFGQGDLKYRAGAFYEEALWMRGTNACETYHLLESTAPAELQVLYPNAGYSVLHSGWGPLDSHIVLDFGGLGMLAGAHAHADALSFTLFDRGKELLLDPGTLVYNCAPEWRNYFRSRRAHNTVVIDGQDQDKQGGTVDWITKHRPRATTKLTLPGADYIEGEHDGYSRLPQGVIHRRRILCMPQEAWIVVDDFRGSGEHKFDLNYHFGPDVDVADLERDESGIRLRAPRAGFLLRTVASQLFVSAEPVRGATSPIGGWASRGYGEKHPCSTLRATLAGPVPAVALTFLTQLPASLAPLPDDSSEPVVKRLKVESGSGIACSYERQGCVDLIAFSTGDDEMAVADLRMRGEFFWLRLEDGALKQVLAVRGRSLTCGDRHVFQHADATTYCDCQ
jgi:hypothetical protein